MDSEPRASQNEKKVGWYRTPEGNDEFYNENGVLEQKDSSDDTQTLYEPSRNIYATRFPDGVVDRYRNGIIFSRKDAKGKEIPPKTEATEKMRLRERLEVITRLGEVIEKNRRVIEDATRELEIIEKGIALEREEKKVAQRINEALMAASSIKKETAAINQRLKENYAEINALGQKIREKDQELEKISSLRIIKYQRTKSEINALKQVKSERERERESLYARLSEIEKTSLYGKI